MFAKAQLKKMNIKSTKFSISQFKKTINSRKRGGFLFFILTPEIADFLIGGKTKNQLRINNRTLDRFVRNIKSGLWEFYNEKIHIIIEENKPVLMDGQHRCLAVIETGISIETILSWTHTQHTNK